MYLMCILINSVLLSLHKRTGSSYLSFFRNTERDTVHFPVTRIFTFTLSMEFTGSVKIKQLMFHLYTFLPDCGVDVISQGLCLGKMKYFVT